MTVAVGGADPGRPPAGETDLAVMLANLSVSRRPGPHVVISLSESVALEEGVELVLQEDEGVTVVARKTVAQQRGWPYRFEAAWLTLEVHSSLEAIGLSAAVAAALAQVGVPCNIVAGYFHDHLLVPLDRADQAINILEGLGQPSRPHRPDPD